MPVDAAGIPAHPAQAKWRRWLAEAGVAVKNGVPVEIDPAYALDAADIKSSGIALGAE